MIPKFAVVGHPNKGKSTIVAALAMDDSVAISDMPGTTTKATTYPLTIDSRVIYELIDTPGFQRPRAVLEILQKERVPAHKRDMVLKEFVEQNSNNPKFADDIELLKPIVEGAGIIYVVDASRPYSVEFELDMQILSYSGAPTMAILNFIDNSDYSKEWQDVLKHYFKITKRFNPMVADINEYIDLLSAIGHLNESWQDSIKESIKLFKRLYDDRLKDSARVISELIFWSMSHTKKVTIKEDTQDIREKLESDFKADLVKKEQSSFKKIKEIWDHNRVKIEQKGFALDYLELFSKESQEYFGLTQKELISYSATLGAVVGAGVDAAFLGHTLLLGAAVGAIGGAVAGYFGLEKLADIKVLGFSIAKKELVIGPIKSINFAFVLLNRALLYTKVVSKLSYAKKGQIDIKEDANILSQSQKKSLFKMHKKIVDGKNLDIIKREYQELLYQILKEEL